MILDGGLATELEARGCDLGDDLWSAGYLLLDPDVIRDVHLAYLNAGADCVISATYQASVQGFRKRGLSLEDVRSVLQLAVDLACQARELFWSKSPAGRERPLVAASIGPYGAYLADGSEYSGTYDRDEDGLFAFHGQRFRFLAQTDADLLACETIPSRSEARALLRLLDANPESWAWMSFSCRDERHLWDGSALAEVAGEVAEHERVVAVGVNCTAPRLVPDLIGEIRRVSEKPIVAYPNSGEHYEVAIRHWIGNPDPGDFAAKSVEWVERGASLVGGCCRTSPEHVRRIRERMKV